MACADGTPGRPALAISALAYFVIAAGKLPTFRLDRTGAAFVGAVAMVILGGLGERQALEAIEISFDDYIRVGLPVTILTLALDIVTLSYGL